MSLLKQDPRSEIPPHLVGLVVGGRKSLCIQLAKCSHVHGRFHSDRSGRMVNNRSERDYAPNMPMRHTVPRGINWICFCRACCLSREESGPTADRRLLTFLVAFLGGAISGLMFDLAAMERFQMFRWSTNIVAISTFILLPAIGIVGLVYERRLGRAGSI